MNEMLQRVMRRPRIAGTLIVATAAILAAAAMLWRGAGATEDMTVLVRKGTLVPRLTATGSLAPAQSITYRSPLGGRETEITFLVAEGTRVNEGDLLVRLETTELQRELERAVQERRQAQVDLQVAEIDRQEGQTAVDSLAAGEGALSVEEAKTRLQLAERRVARLQEEHDTLEPLLEKGFITREELRKTADELDQATEDLALTRRRSEILIEQTHPRDRQRAALLLAQKNAQRENVVARVAETTARVRLLAEQLENSSIYTRRPGLVVYEEFLAASPRRKIRAGDRVTSSQGLLTIPEVDRMLVEGTVSEADVHRLRPGQPTAVFLEAFPGLRLTGKVGRVGTLARSSVERAIDDKRFDLIVDLDPSTADLRPEMTARIDVFLGERPDALLVPLNAVFERDGVTVCHVVRAFSVETRAVRLGESDGSLVEVVSGLTDGDRVALTEVATSSINTPGGAAPAGTTTPGGVPQLKSIGSIKRP
jgi:HlyD family secretion protein